MTSESLNVAPRTEISRMLQHALMR